MNFARFECGIFAFAVSLGNVELVKVSLGSVAAALESDPGVVLFAKRGQCTRYAGVVHGKGERQRPDTKLYVARASLVGGGKESAQDVSEGAAFAGAELVGDGGVEGVPDVAEETMFIESSVLGLPPRDF